MHGIGDELHLAGLDLGDVEIGVERVVWPVLPTPDFDLAGLGYGCIRKSHAEAADAGPVLEVAPVAELKCDAQGGEVHSTTVVEDGDLGEAGPLPLSDALAFLQTQELDHGGASLFRVVNQFRERVGRVLVA